MKTGKERSRREITTPIHQAQAVIGALAYLQQYCGKTIVVKYGGHAMTNETLRQAFAHDVVLLKAVGVHPIIVHGGGPQIDTTMRRMRLEARFVEGLRVTDDETMEVVEMVLGGKLNKDLVATINQHGGHAVGLSGKDANLLLATQKHLYRRVPPDASPELVALGQVGEVKTVNCAILQVLERHGFIPVIAPIGGDTHGVSYNINADTVAGAIAAALKVETLLVLTDVEGILDRDGKLLARLAAVAIEALKQDGVIDGGMLPKVEACLHALTHGVSRTHILDGRVPHAVLQALCTAWGGGTEIIG